MQSLVLLSNDFFAYPLYHNAKGRRTKEKERMVIKQEDKACKKIEKEICNSPATHTCNLPMKKFNVKKALSRNYVQQAPVTLK